jgi:hypothetical protein
MSHSKAPSYAYLKVNSTSGNITTSATAIFDTDLYSGTNPTSTITSDLTWTETAGTITFSEHGAYHVMFACTCQNSADAEMTVAFRINGNKVYEAAVTIAGGSTYDPVERTFQAIIEVSPGDELVIDALVASGNLNVMTGSTAVIAKITSNIYGFFAVSAASGTVTATEFNPWDLDLLVGLAFGFSATNGVSYQPNDADHPFKITTPGRYVVCVSHIIEANAGGSNVTIKLLKNGSEVSGTRQVLKSKTTDDPGEGTMYLVLDLAEDDEIGTTWDTGLSAPQGIHAHEGAGFSIYKLSEDDTPFRDGNRQDAYITVTNGTDASTATASAFNPFLSTAYSSVTFISQATKGITHYPAAGSFRITEYSNVKTGYYMAVFCGPLTAVSADAVAVTISILVNGVAQVTATPRVDTAPDPLDRTVLGLLELSVGDDVTVTLDSDTGTLQAIAGCAFSLHRVAVTKLNPASVEELIGIDNTINTYSPDCMSVQYPSTTTDPADQAPFSLGAGLRIRGTTTGNVVAIELGDKKN